MHASILADLTQTLGDPDFIAAHRVRPQDFSRDRILTFPALVTFLLCAYKGGLQTLLNEFFESLTGQVERVVTKSAVSQARKKLKALAFEALNQRLLTSLEVFWLEPRWRGLRRVAADATTLRLPNWPENQAAFGAQTDPAGATFVMARALGLYCPASGRMLAATLAGYDAAERVLVADLWPHLEADCRNPPVFPTFVAGHHGADREATRIDVNYGGRSASMLVCWSDSNDKALAETINGLYKAEVIYCLVPSKTQAAVQLATVERVAWFNHHRLLECIGDIPPAEAEANDYRQLPG